MSGRSGPIERLTTSDSSAGSAVAVLVTGVAMVAVFVTLGVIATTVYDVLPQDIAFPGLLVTLALLGFGGLYATLRIRDWFR